ncbi:hypothetical protein BSKO_00674 [Bryopsis sp. KO-2023]|nr:hypothetical protein BSKO_00674 [Bryopsis sp. KO-2023]
MKGPTAVLLGAGGTVAMMETEFSDTIRDWVRMALHFSTMPGDSRSKKSGDSGLAAEIESLKRMMREGNSKSVVVVNRGAGSGWGLLTYGCAFAGLGYLYVRYVKGWKLGDLMYVSQATLKASTGALKQGIDGLKDVTNQAKEYLQGRLDTLETNQEDHMERTERIDENLGELGGTVDEMHSELGEVGTNVREVQGTLGEIQEAQTYNTRGIFLLLKVVGEIAHNNDFKLRSRSELDQFSRQAPPIAGGSSAPGLESLLQIGGPETAQASEPTPMYDETGKFEDITDQPLETSHSTGSQSSKQSSQPRVLTRQGTRGVGRVGGGGGGFGSLKR